MKPLLGEEHQQTTRNILHCSSRTVTHDKQTFLNNLVVGGEASAGPGPGDSRRGVPRGHAVEVQTLALLDISYGRLDGDHGGALIRCTNTNTSGFKSPNRASALTFPWFGKMKSILAILGQGGG